MYTKSTMIKKYKWNMLQSGPELFRALINRGYADVSKQRVTRHELNTDVNLIFSEMSRFIQSFTRQNISFIYTCHLYINAPLC